MSTNETFETFWNDLQTICQPGEVIGKLCGRPITFRAIELSRITVDSPDSGGLVSFDRDSFKDIYNNWHSYRYETLSPSNTHLILDLVSITDYVIQTWERRAEKEKVIARAREAAIPDGVFCVVNYNLHSRMIGPRPNGEIILIKEVFPEENEKKLEEIESAALSLFESVHRLCEKFDDKNFSPREWIESNFPQFGKDSHDSVFHRVYMAMR